MSAYKLIFFFICIIFHLSLLAQDFSKMRQTIDSLIANDTDLSEIKNSQQDRQLLKGDIKIIDSILQKEKNPTIQQKAYVKYAYAWMHYALENEVEEAFTYFQEALTEFKKDANLAFKDPQLYYNILHYLAHIERRYHSNYDATEQHYKEILAHYPKDSTLKYTNTMLMLAVLNSNQYKCNQALNMALQAMEIRSKKMQDNDIAKVSGLNILGAVYEQCEEYSKAEEAYLNALKIYRKYHLGKYENKYIEIINNLGVLYMHLDKYEDAEHYLIQVLKYDEKIDKEGPTYALSCHNLAVFYVQKKDFSKANYYYTIALDLEIKNYGKYNYDIALSYKNIGDFYTKQNEFQLAQKAYEECLKIYEKLEVELHQQENIKILHAIADLKIKENNLQAALEYLNTIIALYDNVEAEDYVLFLYLQILDKVIDVHIALGNFKEAESYLKQSITLNAKLPFSIQKIEDVFNHKEWYMPNIAAANFQSYARLKRKKAYLHKPTKQALLEESYACIQEALRINKYRLQDYKNEEEKVHVLEKNYTIIEDAFKVGFALNKPNFQNDAFMLMESNKAALLSESIKAKQAKTLLPIEIADKERELMSIYNDLNYALSEATSSEEELELRKELSDVSLKIQELRKTLETDYPKYYNAIYNDHTIRLETTQSKLQNHELLIEYFVEDSAIYILAITKENAKTFLVEKSRIALAKEVKNFKKLLSNFEYIKRSPKSAYIDYTNLAYHFYTILLKDALSEFPNHNKLIIIPDAELGVLPFEVFLMQKAPQNTISYPTLDYVIKHKIISYHYAANLWARQKDAPITNAQNHGKILGMAGYYTQFNNNHQELKSAQFLQPLQFVKEELQAVKEKYNGDFYLQHPTPENAFKKMASEYDIIHLSMHGLGNEKNPLLSALYFSDFSSQNEDNVLESWEIMQLPLQARLVVLSACESGVGAYLQGEGVSSLARAFMYAGASSLLVSLWKVNDKTTSILMEKYYAALAEGDDKATALQKGKLHLIESYSANIAHPAYWAAFIQIGDDMPIMPRKSTISWIVFSFGIGSMVAFGGFIFVYLQKNKNLTKAA